MFNRLNWWIFVGAVSLSTANANAASITYTYDSLGRITQATYASGAVVTYAYDSGGNITSRVFVAATSTAPGAPTGVTAVGGNGQATVSFAAPANNGGSPITGYTVTSSPGGVTLSGTASPFVVTGLANGTSYTFTVTASNGAGTSAPSAPSNAVTPSGPQLFTVSVSTSGSGTVSSSPAGITACSGSCSASFLSGTVVTLTAANGSDQISSWTVVPSTGSNCPAASATCAFTVTGATSVVAAFTGPRTLTVSTAGNGTGAVASSPSGITCPGTCQATFPFNTAVTLTATPGSGNFFTGWTGACSGAAACQVTMNAGLSVTATFSNGTQKDLVSGFNLIGNATTTAVDVISTFGSLDHPVGGVTASVDAVWAWDAANQKWLFHTPAFTAAGSAAYAAANGFEALTAIAPGKGYWVHATAPFTLAMPGGSPFNTYSGLQFDALPAHAFNLLSIAAVETPRAFNSAVGLTPPSPGIVPENFSSLWAWDAVRGRWYFYSPHLEQVGQQTNAQYCAANGYQDFGGGTPPAPALNLGPGVGFWVQKF